MRKTILLLLIAAFCASSCKDTFMFDKMYEDEGVSEPHSNTLAPLPSISNDKKFDVDLDYLLPKTTYYVRGYCINKANKSYYSLEKSFTTK